MVLHARSIAAFCACVAGALCLLAGAAKAADLGTFLVPQPGESRFEARVGAFAHSVGGWETGLYDVNVELVGPRLPIDVAWPFGFLVPRPHVGVMANTGKRTSYVYAGFEWNVDLTPYLYLALRSLAARSITDKNGSTTRA